MSDKKLCPICNHDIDKGSDCCHYCKNFIGGFPQLGAQRDLDKLNTIKDTYKLLFTNQSFDDNEVATRRSSLQKIVDDKSASDLAVKYLNPAAQWGLTLFETGVALTDDNEDLLSSDKNFRNATSEQNFYNDRKLEILEKFGDDTSLPKPMRSTVEKIRTNLYGTTVRAESLVAGCTDFKKNTLRHSCINAVKEFLSEYDEKEIIIFISAPTRNYSKNSDNKKNESIEYCVAKKLKEQLEFMGIKAFWWETFNSSESPYVWDHYRDDLNISAKIAYGLAVSSIFVALAFDGQNYVNSENCVYELDTFIKNLDKDIMPFILKGKERQDEIVIERVGSSVVTVNSANDYFSELKSVIDKFKSKLPTGRKQYCRVLNANGLGLLKNDNIDLYNSICDDSDQRLVKCKFSRSINRTKAIKEYTSKALHEVFTLLRDSYPSKYNEVKSNYSGEKEFETWFCDPEKDTTSVKDTSIAASLFHEIVNAPTNYNFSYAVLDENGADAYDQIEFFVERTNSWDFDAKRAKRAIRLHMVVKVSNDIYINNKELAKNANESESSIADKCGFLLKEDDVAYQKCSIVFKDANKTYKPNPMKFSEYTRQGGKLCVVKDVDTLNSGIYGTIKFAAEGEGSKSKSFDFAIAFSREPRKMPKVVEHTRGRLYDSVSRKLRCPYCARPLPRFTHQINKTMIESGIKCNGDQCDVQRFDKCEGMILCDQGVEAPSSAFVLPDNYEKSKSAYITMMGLPDAGKSVFISKLFGIESDEIEFESDNSILVKSVQLSDEYIKYALTPYVSEVSCYCPKAIATGEDNPDASLWENKFLRGGGIFTTYCSIPYANFVAKTTGRYGEKLYYAPLILELQTHDGLENYFSFYDLPGEKIETIAKEIKTKFTELERKRKELEGSENRTRKDIESVIKHIRLLQNSNGIILMINVGAHDAAEKKDISGLCEILESFLSRKKYDSEDDAQKRKKASQYKKVKDVAIAVVLCQFDRVEDEFSSNNIVRSLAPLEDADFYKHSEMEKYIDACSTELKKFLSSKGYDRIIKIIDNFTFHKYFAVSAIGHQDSIAPAPLSVDQVDQKARSITRFISNPRGIDNVLIWLAYQMGMID